MIRSVQKNQVLKLKHLSGQQLFVINMNITEVTKMNNHKGTSDHRRAAPHPPLSSYFDHHQATPHAARPAVRRWIRLCMESFSLY